MASVSCQELGSVPSSATSALALGLCCPCLCFPKLLWGQWEGGPLPFFPPPPVPKCCTAFSLLLPLEKGCLSQSRR